MRVIDQFQEEKVEPNYLVFEFDHLQRDGRTQTIFWCIPEHQLVRGVQHSPELPEWLIDLIDQMV